MHEREWMKMKSKITSLIMTTITILMIIAFFILGTIIYNEIIENNLVGEVQEFASNITISSGKVSEDIKTPEILETTGEITE